MPYISHTSPSKIKGLRNVNIFNNFINSSLCSKIHMVTNLLVYASVFETSTTAYTHQLQYTELFVQIARHFHFKIREKNVQHCISSRSAS